MFRAFFRLFRRIVGWGLLVLIVVFVGYLAVRFLEDEPVTYADDRDHFKYGSTGGDRLAGIPTGIWQILPTLCAKYLPGDGWQSLGFIYEPGKDLPIGTSVRRSFGFDRVFLNCAACHSGTYRETPDGEPTIVLGMPANNLDLATFRDFLGQCTVDEEFNSLRILAELERAGVDYDWIDRATLGTVGIPLMRFGLLLARHRFRFLDRQPEAGPGRFDTFNPAKVLMNWPLEKLPEREWIGLNDFPSLWIQGQREDRGMQLHWDGNNDSVDERNRSAAFGSGGLPVVIDRESLARTAAWLRNDDVNVPPAYPFPIDGELAAKGKPLYARYCADCHGVDGRNFEGKYVGKVEPIDRVRTDPCRLDNYTRLLAVNQNLLYGGFPEERFRRFRKTNGYANMPLDGIWLRGPYLHNGSVPSLRDLLEPSENRPKVFYRGNDVFDQKRVGFVSDVAEQNGRTFFRFETQCVDDPERGVFCAHEKNPENRYPDNQCVVSKWAGNGNRGHEGRRYGTHLAAADKDAIVEYLKTF